MCTHMCVSICICVLMAGLRVSSSAYFSCWVYLLHSPGPPPPLYTAHQVVCCCRLSIQLGWIGEPPDVQAVQATTQPQGFLVGSEQAEQAAAMGYKFLVSGLRVTAHFSIDLCCCCLELCYFQLSHEHARCICARPPPFVHALCAPSCSERLLQ